MANNILEVTWKTSLITRNKGTKEQEILLLEFCKQLRGQREQTMSTMSTQHAPAVRVIRVMDSIPWVRCASGNVYETQKSEEFLQSFSPHQNQMNYANTMNCQSKIQQQNISKCLKVHNHLIEPTRFLSYNTQQDDLCVVTPRSQGCTNASQTFPWVITSSYIK